MDLNSLSTELISLILSFIAADTPLEERSGMMRKSSMKNYACISRRWQAIVEPPLFYSIEVKSTEIDQFGGIFSSRRRRMYLSCLQYSIVLPIHSDNRRATFETGTKNNMAFHHGMLKLSELLSSWNSESIEDGDETTDFSTLSYSGFDLDMHDRPSDRSEDDYRSAESLRAVESIPDFPNDAYKALPAVTCIDDYSSRTERIIHPQTIQKIIAALPRRECFKTSLADIISSGASVGGKSLSSNLQYIRIRCNIRSPEDTWCFTDQEDPIIPDDDQSHIHAKDVEGPIDESSSTSNESDSPENPAFVDVTPEELVNGNLRGHSWPAQINEERFNPSLKAMMLAVLRLPQLTLLDFSTSLEPRCKKGVLICCADAGQQINSQYIDETQDELGVRRCRVWVGIEVSWSLPPETEALMREWVGVEGIVWQGSWPRATGW